MAVPSYAAGVLAEGATGYWRLNEQGYARQVLALGPLAYWRMGDLASDLTDSSGHAHTASDEAGPATYGQAGPISDGTTAIKFASGAYFNAGDNFEFSGTAAFSFTVWVKFDGTETTALQRIASKERVIVSPASPAGTHGWRVAYAPSTRVVTFVRVRQGGFGGPAAVILSSAALSLNVWHLIVATYDGATMRLYLDAALQGTAAATESLVTSTTPFLIGSYSVTPGSLNFQGTMAEAAPFDYALPAEAVTALYAARTGTDATASAQAADSSGNGNHGTYGGGVLLGTSGALADTTTAARCASPDAGVVVPDLVPTVPTIVTLEAWVKRSSALVSADLLAVWGSAASAVYHACFNADWTLGASVNGTLLLTDYELPDDGDWHLIVAEVEQDGDVTFYADDNKVGQVDAQIDLTADPPTVIGNGGADLAVHVGYLDEAAFYPRALALPQIAVHYRRRLLSASSEYPSGSGRIARLGCQRLGASRLGAIQPTVTMTIDGYYAQGDAVTGLAIQHIQDGTPNTCHFRIHGLRFTPQEGQDVRIGAGDLATSRLMFAGTITALTQIYVGGVANIWYDVTCTSYEWQLNARKLSGLFTAAAVSDIIAFVMDSAPNFALDGVADDLGSIDEFSFTNQYPGDILDQLAKRGGWRWVITPDRVLHFGADIEPSASAVHDITTANPHSMEAVAKSVDLSQVKTRVLVEAGGAASLADLEAGDTIIPVDDPSWYDDDGGTVAIAQNRAAYTGVVQGGTGALIGTTVTPTNPPVAMLAIGTGIEAGVHKYAQTFVTASGETLPSPLASVAVGTAIPATTAPGVTRDFGGNLSTGNYQWAVTGVDSAGGETAPSPLSAVLAMGAVATAPTTIGDIHERAEGHLAAGTYHLKYLFTNGSVHTLPSPASNAAVLDGSALSIRMDKAGVQTPPTGFVRQFYRDKDGGGYFALTGPVDGFSFANDDSFFDLNVSASGAAIPGSSTAVYGKANLSLPTFGSADIVSLNIYRTEADGSTLKLVDTVDNGTIAYVDDLADGSLGVTAPSVGTAVYSRVALSDIAIGPTGTTGRNIYRTEADAADLKLLTSIADNTTPTFADSTADASLGSAAPGSDTSGLVTEVGEVAVGSTSIPVTSTAPFESGGGWARVGSVVVRYTGLSLSALTGVPASGRGALTSAVRYGTEVIACAMLTGIPASGEGSILYAVLAGEPVNLLVTRNDTDAQAVMAALLSTRERPHDGIIEEYIKDNRLSQAEAEARGDARLIEVKDPLVTIRYQTRDMTTCTGRDVTFALDAPTNIVGTFRIQSMTFSDFAGGRVRPIRTIEAGSRRFSFEQLLRLVKAA